MNLGLLAFCLAVLFQLVTLPVEFNASHRALIQLRELHILPPKEEAQARSVLFAAALTYVAGAASSPLTASPALDSVRRKKAQMTAPNARSIALDCLLLITEEGQFSHVVLAAARDKFAWMPEEERALTERLVHGSVEYLPQLDRLIAARSKTRPETEAGDPLHSAPVALPAFISQPDSGARRGQ